MTPNAEPTNFANADGISVAQWLSVAAAGYTQISPANFSIVTNVGPLSYRGQVQEFIVPTPGTIVLMLVGIAFIFFLFQRRQSQVA